MLPTYDQLLRRTDAPPGSTWGLFGEDDDLGTLNFLTPERAVRAAGLVRRGEVFNLDLPVHAFDPPITHRTPPRHTIFVHAPYHRDDRLDDFFLQGTTQIDGLRHFRHPTHGFYNRVTDDQVAAGTPRLGIQVMSEKGIVGRGVLLDVAAHREAVGDPVRQVGPEPTALTVTDLEETAAAQGVALEAGDVLLIRTGWVAHVRESGPEERAAIAADPVSPGLEQSEALLRWLWEHQVALLAADNLGVEVLPSVSASPHRQDPGLAELRGRHTGMAHPVLLALLGLPLGELWDLDALADDCRGDRVWEFLLTASPLNVEGGVGSPANAMAVK